MLVSAVELFEDVIDQKSAVTQLQITSKNPVHAYLFLAVSYTHLTLPTTPYV